MSEFNFPCFNCLGTSHLNSFASFKKKKKIVTGFWQTKNTIQWNNDEQWCSCEKDVTRLEILTF